MKARMPSLSGDSLLQSIRDHFKLIKDHRRPGQVRIALSDFLMSGFSVFCLKFASLLQFEQDMRKRKMASHLSPMFKLIEVPSDTHMRSVLDEVDPESIAPIFKKLFNKVQESKRLEEFRFLNNAYLMSVDGSQYFSSRDISCDSCMSKKVSEEDEGPIYYHQMLAGCIVHPEQKTVLPLCPEPLKRQDGNSKNDCERAAMIRFLDRFRADHPKLPAIIIGDALHATGPIIRHLTLLNARYILGVKPGSHAKLFEGVEKWAIQGKVQAFTFEETLGQKIKKQRTHRFRYANNILYNYSHLDLGVNFFEYWETTTWIDPKGRKQEKQVHFSWITDFEINNDNIMKLMRGGRARWKIENETFNTLKNQGYEFEHNFGHGNKNLSTVFGYLMFLSFLFDQVSELGCKSFQAALKHFTRKKYLRESLRSLFHWSYTFGVTFEGWIDFLDQAIAPRRSNTS